MKALSDENRLAILLAIADRSSSVTELVAEIGLSQPLVSHHLKTLRENGLVVSAAIGRSNVYSLCCDALAEPIALLGGTELPAVPDLKGIPMTVHDDQEIREAVRERYAAAATGVTGPARPSASSCCGPTMITLEAPDLFGHSHYNDEQREALPEEALLASLGCGNPTALAELKPGETVLDLGAGGGIDVLLSARRVAPGGKAYGLDMTHQMLELAEANRAKAGIDNAEFLLGSIEDVPLPDASVDVIISNCVVNLSTDKDLVFGESFRVLKPGGRFAISDMVLSRELPAELGSIPSLWTGCIAGALTEEQVIAGLERAGFEDVCIEPTTVFGRNELDNLVAQVDPATVPSGIDLKAAVAPLQGVIRSAFIRANKPA